MPRAADSLPGPPGAGLIPSPPPRLPFDRDGRLDPRAFPPPASYNRQDRKKIGQTSPEHVLAHAAYETLTGLMGVGTASAPQTADVAARDRRDPGITPAQQAANIAVAMIPVEKILGLAGRAVADVATKSLQGLTKAEWRTALNRLLLDRTGGIRVPGTILPPLERGKLALLDIAASSRPIVVRDLSVVSVEALMGEYGAGLAVALNEKGTIAAYDALAKSVEGLGGAYQAHHIVEVQVLERLGYPVDKCPAIVLTAQQHSDLTTALAKQIPPGGLDHLTNQEILHAYENVYRNHPDWIAEVRRYLR